MARLSFFETAQRTINTDLKQQLLFYGAYHRYGIPARRILNPLHVSASETPSHPVATRAARRNPKNQLIHFIFVPVILFTIVLWLSYTPPVPNPIHSSSCLAPYLVLNGGFFLVAVYSVYYIILDTIAGLSWAACVGFPIWVGAEYLQQTHPGNAWLWAIYAHVFAWFMQIVPGHMYFEMRRPSLMDSFVQSLLLAPLFVWFELLFVLGYRKDLAAEISRAATADVLEETQEGRRRLLDGDKDEDEDQAVAAD